MASLLLETLPHMCELVGYGGISIAKSWFEIFIEESALHITLKKLENS